MFVCKFTPAVLQQAASLARTLRDKSAQLDVALTRLSILITHPGGGAYLSNAHFESLSDLHALRDDVDKATMSISNIVHYMGDVPAPPPPEPMPAPQPVERRQRGRPKGKAAKV